MIEPHEYGQFQRFLADPPSRKRNAWSYIDARDLGEIVRLCLEKDGLGFQVFNATNDTITLDTPTREAMKKLCPNTPFTREVGEFEAPLSNRKAREMLGFKEAHNWRKYVDRGQAREGDGADALLYVPRGFARAVGGALAGSSGQMWRG